MDDWVALCMGTLRDDLVLQDLFKKYQSSDPTSTGVIVLGTNGLDVDVFPSIIVYAKPGASIGQSEGGSLGQNGTTTIIVRSKDHSGDGNYVEPYAGADSAWKIYKRCIYLITGQAGSADETTNDGLLNAKVTDIDGRLTHFVGACRSEEPSGPVTDANPAVYKLRGTIKTMLGSMA